MNATPSVKDVEIVQVDTTALIVSCVEPVASLARMYSRLSSQVDGEDLAQIGMLRVCEMAPRLYPMADTKERLVRCAGRAMLDEIKLLSLHPTVSLEAYLASTPFDSFVTDPFSGTLLTLVGSSDIEDHALFGRCVSSVQGSGKSTLNGLLLEQACDLPIVMLDTDEEFTLGACETTVYVDEDDDVDLSAVLWEGGA